MGQKTIEESSPPVEVVGKATPHQETGKTSHAGCGGCGMGSMRGAAGDGPHKDEAQIRKDQGRHAGHGMMGAHWLWMLLIALFLVAPRLGLGIGPIIVLVLVVFVGWIWLSRHARGSS